MTQYLRPASDVSAGAWTAAPLWSKINDDLVAQPSGDGVEIQSSNNSSGDTYDFALTAGTDPGVDTGHVLKVRWRKSAAGGHQIDNVLELHQGAPPGVLIATVSQANIGETEQENSHSLLVIEAVLITNYGQLHGRLIRNGDQGGPPGERRSAVVEAVVLEIPDAATPPQTLAGSIASDPWTATTGQATPGAASLSGSIAADSWSASDGQLAPGVSTLGGAAAADAWLATAGDLAPGAALLSGVAAADPWQAADGALAPGVAVLDGLIAADPWTANTGALDTTSKLAGVPAFDSWQATTGNLEAGPAVLEGDPAADPWLAAAGALAPDSATLTGATGADPWTATSGSIEVPSAILAGSLAADPWQAVTGGLQPGAAALSGAIAADSWTANTGALAIEGIEPPGPPDFRTARAAARSRTTNASGSRIARVGSDGRKAP